MRTTALLATAIVVAFLFSCSRNKVTLSFTNAKDEVPQLGNLVFRFSNSLAPDSMLNLWDSTEYISFSPKIPGRFRWEAPDQLVFSPAEPLRGATSYKGKLKDEILRHSKYDKIEGDDEVKFHTPLLALENTSVIWMLREENSSNAFPQIDLQFNYPIEPADLKKKLNLEVDGKQTDFQLVTASKDSRMTLRLNGVKTEDRDYSAKLVIDKGLKPVGGEKETKDAIKTDITIPSPYVLSIQHIESEHDGSEGIVHVQTSQQVSAESLKSFVKFDPGVAFSVEPEETGFVVRSDKFSVEDAYAITITQGLRGKVGGMLKEDYYGSVAFGELEANIAFTNSKAVYLSKRGGKNIEVRITNVPKIRLVISKIYENNLLMAQRYGYSPQENANARTVSHYDEESEGEYYDEGYGANALLGDVIYEKEIDTRALPKMGAGRLLDMRQFEDRLPEFKGIYHVMIRSSENYWVRDSRFISVSDIGLIAKEASDKLFVFTNSIKTSESLSGVSILAYGNNNQLLGAGTTNNDGVAEIEYSRKEFKGFKPAMIIAKTDDDMNYLPFQNTRVNTSRFEVGGKRINPSGLDPFIYAERDIYRPGERVNFSVVIRNREWKVPGDIPLKLKFLMPDGKELKEFRKNLNEQGSLEGNIDISNAAITGSYTLEVYSSTDLLLATKNFNIEEFVPDRIRVNAKLDQPFLTPGSDANLSINATNFFGPPAANRNYESQIQVRQKVFAPKGFEDYDFTIANQAGFSDNIENEGKTDASGNANVNFEVPDEYNHRGLLQASFYTTVFDETGRPVSRITDADIFTQDVFLGIKQDYSYYHPLNRPVTFELASLNRNGQATRTTATIQVVKREYHTSLRKSGSFFRYESERRDKVLTEQKTTLNGKSNYVFVPRSAGDYEIRIFAPGAETYVKKEFYSYGSTGSEYNSFEVNNEGHVTITPDKEFYESGSTAKILFKTPFSGRMLVTMESDKVVSYQYLIVNDRSASIDLNLDEKHLPNVYITATLIKAHEISDIPLTVAHGFTSVTVEQKNRKIPVQITAVKTARSRTSQEVKVQAAPGSFVTLAAVDNGVLQVTDFKTPDPYRYYYQKKALDVTSYDLYPLLFPELRARLSSTGGDGPNMEKRVNPMPAKRIKILSYWSGITKANGSGEATFRFDIPQFSGEVRLMAVAYKDEKMGSAEATITVADPVVLSTALPRFLSPGDTVTVPVTISNTTAKSASGRAVVTVSGPLAVAGNSSQSVSMSANAETRAVFKIVASQNIGVANIKVQVDALNEKFIDETEISVRPASGLQKVTGSGVLEAGRTERINIGLRDFIPGSVKYNLVVARSPAIDLGKHLAYLVQYPYGCTEQVISSAFPQLYYGDMADLMKLNRGRTAGANANILEAIRKIKMRQLYNGALILWDGEGIEDWWTTIYAAHFLLEAKKAGFTIESNLLEPMLSYLNNRLKKKETITYYYNRDQNKKIAPKEVAYSLYVLAIAGRANVSGMNYYKSNPQLLALDGKYLLSAAYAMAGDKKSFSTMLPASFTGEKSVPQTGGSYYSDVRDEAIALNALLEVDPRNAQIPVMAKHINDKLKTRQYLSTQERSFSFLALGKIARAASQSKVTAEIKVNGKTIATIDGNDWRGDMTALKGTQVDIVTKGTGRLYYYWEAEGISSGGNYVEEDNYLRVRRKFYDRNGREMTSGNFAQNDLVIIGITLEKTYSGTVENIVITDILPAGFEIENPRTKEIPGMDWIKDAATPTSLDVRDDRIHFFVDLNSPKQVYFYAVRAVSPGNYRMGPVGADAMYNGEYHSYHGARQIRIAE